MNFQTYYGAILRRRTQTQPRADEARRDYQRMLQYTVVAGTL